ncbi:hypothetical protein HN011_005891 [Eciton burchellii]|nr:hypothetical protein HN011_005891 [Eciton burchellii]
MWVLRNIYRFVLFPLLCTLQCYRCFPANSESADPAGIEHLEWRTHLRPEEPLRFSRDVSYHRDKRLISLGSATLGKQKIYQACIAPGNQSGHCSHSNECGLDDFRSNFSRFMDYMCIIEQTYVGVCCPDSILAVKSGRARLDDLAGMLPAIANIEDDKLEKTDEKASISHEITDEMTWQTEVNSSAAKEAMRKPRRPRGCGTTTKMKLRIAGGQPADPKEWPWMAALLREGTIQYCGGVLITDRHVLTAAHCVYEFNPRDITVRLGEYDFTKSDETRALDFMVTEIRIHRDFRYNTYENDIAIVKIHRPTIFNSYIWPICLPPIQQTFENKDAIVTGWGTQYYGGPASTVLMEVVVPVWPQEKCVRSFTQRIVNTTMCAGAHNGGRDACQGDSGGPLLHQLANGKWVNIGIVSWGIRCGEPGYPGVYTRVSSYLDWIFANAAF